MLETQEDSGFKALHYKVSGFKSVRVHWSLGCLSLEDSLSIVYARVQLTLNPNL